jgi:cytochrome P450
MLQPLNIASPDYHNHLYDYYARLRDTHPAYYDASRDIWMITRYEDVRALLRDSERARNDNTSHTYVSTLAGSDGELHDHLRGELIPRFSQAVAKTLEPMMDDIMKGLFESLPTRGEIDIYNLVVKRVPQQFMTRFLGFPPELARRWFELGDPLMGIDPQKPIENVDPRRMNDLLDQVMELMQEALACKRAQPADDFLSWLVGQEREGKLTEQEVTMFANNLGVGGLDTTINLLGNGTGLLARFPEQRAKLLANPGLMDGAIEEMLRIESPAQALPRRLVADVEVAETRIPAGSEISLVFGAANHDPNKYPEPELFDIGRRNFDHLAMGFGLHKCVGQHLARMEARSYFTYLLEYFPEFEIVESRWLVSWWARGYAALTISA